MSSDNRILSNELSENTDGIAITKSLRDDLAGNIVSSKNSGIRLSSSTLCNITGNTATGCGNGIVLVNCNRNLLIQNNLSKNNEGLHLDDGVYPEQSSGNEIYLNSFVDNNRDVYSFISSNSWMSAELLSYRFHKKAFENRLGNYWQKAQLKDDNGDGIGDQAYSIGTDIDEGPLVESPKSYWLL